MTRPVALVTGASTGIGLAFAQALAGRGHDLVVVARDETRLRRLADELPVDVEVLPADLTATDGLAAVEARLRDAARPVDLLVNNAGFGTSGPFVDADADAEDNEIQLNVAAVTRLAHAVLPQLVHRRTGGVIFVSSLASFQPAAGAAVYAATKAYVTSLGLGLYEECRGTGVKILTTCPGLTRTEFQARSGFHMSHVPAFVWQTADDVVAETLVAYDKGRAMCVPGVVNRVTHLAVRLTPGDLSRRVAGIISGRN